MGFATGMNPYSIQSPVRWIPMEVCGYDGDTSIFSTFESSFDFMPEKDDPILEAKLKGTHLLSTMPVPT